MSLSARQIFDNRPDKVPVRDLNIANGKLYTERFIQRLLKAQLSDNHFYSQEDLRERFGLPRGEPPFAILKSGGKLFAVHNSELGKGMSSSISPAQDLQSGEWIALKKFQPLAKVEQEFEERYQSKLAEQSEEKRAAFEKRHQEFREIFYKNKLAATSATLAKEFQHEGGVLARLKESKGEPVLQKSQQGEHAYVNGYLPMTLARGKDLASLLGFSGGPRILSLEQVAVAAQKYGKELILLLAQGVVPRDIHPNNVMYEPKSETLKIVDHGDSLLTKVGVREADARPLGSEPFMPPEILRALHQLKSQDDIQATFNEKTVVYSFGAILASFYHLGNAIESPYLRDEDTHFKSISLKKNETQTSLIESASMRKAMLELLRKMMAPNPEVRPTMAEALKELVKIQTHLMPLRPSSTKKALKQFHETDKEMRHRSTQSQRKWEDYRRGVIEKKPVAQASQGEDKSKKTPEFKAPASQLPKASKR